MFRQLSKPRPQSKKKDGFRHIKVSNLRHFRCVFHRGKKCKPLLISADYKIGVLPIQVFVLLYSDFSIQNYHTIFSKSINAMRNNSTQTKAT